jgi:predicted nuclease of restriction endonuclease-like (RecB) superfamily
MNLSIQPSSPDIDVLHQQIRELIGTTQTQMAIQVNQALVLTYWQIGKTIKTNVLTDGRASYGAGTLKQLAKLLTLEYGNGFSHSSLTRMVKFFDYLPDQEIVATVSQQLSWSHFVELIKLDDQIKREFYLGMCAQSRWSVRTLRERINSMLFERTAISKQPDLVIEKELVSLQKHQIVTPQLLLKDPYLLDFLDLQGDFTEKDLESGILRELERFLLELGSDFAFMNRQKRIQIGGNDYYIDLLFFHRRMKRLVLIELKLGDFKPDYKGQVELYLRWLAKYEQQPDEESPIGIILCTGKDDAVVELLDLEQDGIHVAEYWLQLPPREVLQAKLQRAIAQAQARMGYQGSEDD